MPGLFLRAQPSPQLTTPARNIRLPVGLDRGPPESPWKKKTKQWRCFPPPPKGTETFYTHWLLRSFLTWQASTPPLSTPAQNIRDVIWPPIRELQTSWLMIRTWAFWSTVDALPEWKQTECLGINIVSSYFEYLFFKSSSCRSAENQFIILSSNQLFFFFKLFWWKHSIWPLGGEIALLVKWALAGTAFYVNAWMQAKTKKYNYLIK